MRDPHADLAAHKLVQKDFFMNFTHPCVDRATMDQQFGVVKWLPLLRVHVRGQLKRLDCHGIPGTHDNLGRYRFLVEMDE